MRSLASIAAAATALVALPECNDVIGITSLSVAPSSDDAGADATGDWCAVHAPDATACEDFDGPNGFASGGWSAPIGSSAENGVLDDAAFRSPPRALTVSSPALPSGARPAQWYIAHPFPESRRVSLAFDARIDTRDPDGAYVTLADIALAGAPPSEGTHVSITYDRVGLHIIVLQTQQPVVDHTLAASPAIVIGAWARIELNVERDSDGGAGAVVSVRLDGHAVMLADGTPAARFLVAGAGNTTVILGAGFVSSPSIAQVVHIDDAVIDLR